MFTEIKIKPNLTSDLVIKIAGGLKASTLTWTSQPPTLWERMQHQNQREPIPPHMFHI